MTDSNNGIGKMLKTLRTQRGMTQDEVARAAGFQRSTVGGVECGRQMLNVHSINAIAGALGYDVRVQFVRRDRPLPASDSAPLPAAGIEVLRWPDLAAADQADA